MKKKMKVKDIRRILFPSIACATAAVFGIPMLCEISSGHLSMDYAHQRWAKIEEEGVDTFKYTFILDEQFDKDNQIIEIALENAPLYKDAACKGVIEVDPEPDKDSPTRIHQVVKLVRWDGKPLQYFDAAFFNLKFTLINKNTKQVIWTDEIDSLRLRYEVEGK